MATVRRHRAGRDGERGVRRAAGVVAGLGLGLGVVWPLVALVLRSGRPFAGRAAMSGEVVGRVLGDQRTWQVLGSTILQASWSTAVCLGLGLPLAWVLARREVPGRHALEVLLTVPFVLPSLVVAAAVLEASDLVGRRGEHPLVLVVAAHAVFDVGLVARLVAPALGRVGAPVEEAARMLGRSPRRAAAVTLRLAAPTVAGAAVLVFLLSVTSFGVVLALGGRGVTTLEVEIWVRATRLLDLPGAAVLAGVQATLGIAVLAAAGRLRPWTSTGRNRSGTAPRAASRRPGRAAVGAWAVALAVVGAPLVALIMAALRRDGRWTVANVADLATATLPGGGPSLAGTLGRSLAFGLVAGVLAVVVGGAAVAVGWRVGTPVGRAGALARTLAVAPLGTSAAVLGLGWLVGFGGAVDLRGTAAIVVGAQAVVALPLVVQTLGPALGRVDGRAWQAATVAGAGPGRRWREVAWPAVARSAAVGFGFAVATALGEVGAVSFVASDDHATAPVALARLLARPGAASEGRAGAVAAVLALACAAVFVAAERVGRSPERPVR